jgi:hypothetical protein
MSNAEESPLPKNNHNPAGLNWPTLILILLTGGGNFFAVQKNSSERQFEQERAYKQISELHAALDDELKRIATILKNQETLLQNQERALQELRKSQSP